jgi:GntR family transcriptional regulator
MPEAALDLLPARTLLRRNGPLYRQLADMLRASILDGTYPIGASLPKEAELAERCGISLITVRHALRELESDGLIQKRAAKPAVVAAQAPALRQSWGFRNFADIEAYTRHARLEIISYRRDDSPEGRAVFGLSQREACYCLRGILVVGGQPETQVTTYFPPEIGSRLNRTDFDDVLIFRSVERHLGLRLAAARITVRAEVAGPELARDLAIDEGAPILTMEMLYRSADQQPVEFTIARHSADTFSLTYDAPNDMP